jgi:serine/threonine protein kinase
MAMSSVNAGSLVGERLGKYHLLALIAIGGTAEIYLARIAGEAGFEKYVVVKCLLDHLADDADFVRMFLDEARLCAQLDHSNIVQTLELGQHEGRFYMVMEHLAGMSLAQLARKTHERVPEGVIPTRIVLGLAAQACAGLHYAHQRTGTDGTQLNVVHRDVSPQNLVVTFEGMLKIVDFGIAKAELRQTHTRSGTIKGKFAYMSPEQCLAEPIDKRTDVFALGTVVHELLTARRLFKRANTYETYQAILKGNAPPPSRYNKAVDDELDRVVLRALAYHREERYESTEAFGEAMLGWLHSHGQSVSATDVSRYVEKVCAPEIDDHAAHMRELISGHQVSRSETLRWDVAAEEEAESKSLGASPMSSDNGLGLASSDFPDEDSSVELPSQEIPARTGGGGTGDDDFAGDTQIELDPLERVAALEAQAAEERQARATERGSTAERSAAPAAAAALARAAAGNARGEPANFPPATLRRASGPSPAASAAAPGQPRRKANEPTEPELIALAHDQLTMPASDMIMPVGDERGRRPASSPIAVYETPLPGSAGQMWGDDSAEVLRHGRSQMGPLPHAPPRPPTPPPELSPALPPMRPMLQRGPMPGPGPGMPGDAMPIWLLAVVFVISAGLGLGLTVLIGSLVA